MSDWTVVLGALVGGLSGAAGGWLTAARTTTSAEKVAAAQRKLQSELAQGERDHDRQLAQDARLHERWQDTYVDLIDFLNRWNEVARLTT